MKTIAKSLSEIRKKYIFLFSYKREDTRIKINYRSETSKKNQIFVLTNTDEDQSYVNIFSNYENAIAKSNKKIVTIYSLWMSGK